MTDSQRLIGLIVWGLLSFGCHQAASDANAASAPDQPESICESLSPSAESVAGEFEGCPIIAPAASAVGAPSEREQFEKLRESQRQFNSKMVKVFRAAEKDGFLNEPEVARRLMNSVAIQYMKEKGVELEISYGDTRTYFESHRSEFARPQMRIGRVLAIEFAGQKREEVETQLLELRRAITEDDASKSRMIAAIIESSTHPTARTTMGLLEPTARDGDERTVAPELANATFELDQVGDVSLPFEVDGGLAIVMLDRIVPGTEVAFEDVDGLIRQRIREQRIDDFIAGADP